VNLGSYKAASEVLEELAGLEISPQRIRRALERIGQERPEERREAATRYEQMDLAGEGGGTATAG